MSQKRNAQGGYNQNDAPKASASGDPSRDIYISGFPKYLSILEVKTFINDFLPDGQVESVTVPPPFRGFAFLKLNDSKDVENAVKILSQQLCEGRRIKAVVQVPNAKAAE